METASSGHTPITPRKKMTKQLTGKRDDTALHSSARAGNIIAIREIISDAGDDQDELTEILSKQNSAGETGLYVAAEYGYFEIVREMIQYHDLSTAGIKARNGFDALHIAAKQGDLEVVKVLLEAHPELSMTVDSANATALHTAATQGRIEVVKYFLDSESSLSTIARSNGKTALHSSARNGHVEVVKALLLNEPGLSARVDKKGQSALHMAAKGRNLKVVEALIESDPSTINMVDSKGNTPLHIASRKGKTQVVKTLLSRSETDTRAINRSNETALDTATKLSHPDIAATLESHGAVAARALNPPPSSGARELDETVFEIKHEVHDQLEHARRTRKRVRGIAKRITKMHAEGLNNAVNSTTVVAVLIATVAFAAIFTVPGQYVGRPGPAQGEARIAGQGPFVAFFVLDSVALFISLAVVVVQTSVVVIESEAKRKMMAVINKLMWIACVLVSAAYLALAFVVVGKEERWLAVGVTVVGTTIMVATIGTMCYWVVRHRINRRNNSRSRSELDNEFKRPMYAI